MKFFLGYFFEQSTKVMEAQVGQRLSAIRDESYSRQNVLILKKVIVLFSNYNLKLCTVSKIGRFLFFTSTAGEGFLY
jgi:hypothetical protein